MIESAQHPTPTHPALPNMTQTLNIFTLQTSTAARLEPGSTVQVYKDKATIQSNGVDAGSVAAGEAAP